MNNFRTKKLRDFFVASVVSVVVFNSNYFVCIILYDIVQFTYAQLLLYPYQGGKGGGHCAWQAKLDITAQNHPKENNLHVPANVSKNCFHIIYISHSEVA